MYWAWSSVSTVQLFSCLSSLQPYRVGIVISILQMWKLRHKKIKNRPKVIRFVSGEAKIWI